MSFRSAPHGRSRAVAIMIAAVTGAALAIGTSPSAQAAPSAATDLYIVQVAGAPIASYSGNVAGYPATRPAAGHKLDAHSARAEQYKRLLTSRQSTVLSRSAIATGKVVYRFATTFNGVAVQLTASQAQKLKTSPNVVNVFKNRTVTAQIPPTPRFLGLTGRDGVWNKQFNGDKRAGARVIVGDLDTGFWPESPSFAALPPNKHDDKIIAAKWHGTCDPGLDHPVTCNNKVIGAHWYNASGAGDVNPGEYHSPRDFDGHGSHTASTAAGNHVFDVSVNGIPVGDLEGVAPAARIAVYKVLYENANATAASGGTVDIIAAIDQAVADGVDVINFSVGDDVDAFGPEELSFLEAAQAGVFVSAAAGNAGPGAGTVDNAMPWEATVAAGTFDQESQKSVTLGDGATYTGVGRGAAVPSTPLVDAANVALAGHTAADAELCIVGSLDPAKVTGKIVLCARGVNNRIDKSAAVKQAGGVGMVLYNPTPNSLNADFHFVPTVHLDSASGLAIKAYIGGTANPTASLSAAATVTVEAPTVAAFSSRGPSPSSGGSLLKPDVMAPGVDVVAAVSPSNHSGNLYDAESGTSMSTPHIAGVAALLMSKHPDWNPMWVKSAIMTGAATLDNEGNPIQGADGDATPFDMGAGEVVPAKAFDPGLVYDSGITEWLQYSCGIGVHLALSDGSDVCDAVGSIAPTDLNYPSIAIGDLVGQKTTVRTVTNTEHGTAEYRVKVNSPAGFTTTVSPSVLRVRGGRTAQYQVTITRTDATFGEYSFGSLTWSDHDGHHVRSPIAAQAVPVSAPAEVTGTGASGSEPLDVRAGYTGTLTAQANGLVPATVSSASLVTDTAGFDTDAPASGPGTMRVDFSVPAGTELARVQSFASDYAAGTDIDVFVYSSDAAGDLTLAGQSAGGTADEVVDLTDPGDYSAFVDVFANPAGPTSPLTVNGYQWSVAPGNAGNFTVTPASQPVTITQPAPVTVAWSGLTNGTHYLGVVDYGDGSQQIGQTIVAVN